MGVDLNSLLLLTIFRAYLNFWIFVFFGELGLYYFFLHFIYCIRTFYAQIKNSIQFHSCTSAALGVGADLWASQGDLAEEVQNGRGEDGVNAEEEVDAHVGDEGHLRILEHA